MTRFYKNWRMKQPSGTRGTLGTWELMSLLSLVSLNNRAWHSLANRKSYKRMNKVLYLNFHRVLPRQKLTLNRSYRGRAGVCYAQVGDLLIYPHESGRRLDSGDIGNPVILILSSFLNISPQYVNDVTYIGCCITHMQ
jgi:hypothetical protein